MENLDKNFDSKSSYKIEKRALGMMENILKKIDSYNYMKFPIKFFH